MTHRDESDFDRRWRERQAKIDRNLKLAAVWGSIAVVAAAVVVILNIMRITGLIP